MPDRRLAGSLLAAGGFALAVLAPPAAAACHPTAENRPVCPGAAPFEEASFLDPTALVREPAAIAIGERTYVGPFAKLRADDLAPIEIGESSNAQDNVTVDGGPRGRGGVRIGDRVILAHGATVRGPASIGVTGAEGGPPLDPDADAENFVSFGAMVDGATLERNTQVSALARVGPGVVLRSGTVVLPGKDVDTQQEADDPALGKVRALTAGDVAFAEAVVEVNDGLAREYSVLAREDPFAVRGIGPDPGGTAFNPDRDLPRFEAEVPEPGPEFEECTGGEPTAVPQFRNRIIGEVCLRDTLEEVIRRTGERVSLRADEGEPLSFGHIRYMATGFTSHALEETTVEVGDDVTYGRRAIVHGGGRRIDGAGRGAESTFIEDGVVLRPRSVTFRSFVGERSRIGAKSAVVSSDLPPRTRIPDRVIYLNNAVFGRVEW